MATISRNIQDLLKEACLVFDSTILVRFALEFSSIQLSGSLSHQLQKTLLLLATKKDTKFYPKFSVLQHDTQTTTLFSVTVCKNAYCMSTKCPGDELALASGEIYTAVMMGVNSGERYMGLLLTVTNSRCGER